MTTSSASYAALIALLACAPAAAQPGVPPCRVEGEAVTAEDAGRALAACEAAHARFVELLGSAAPGVIILVEERSGYRIGILDGQAVVLWPSTRAMRLRAGTGRGADAYLATQWNDVLRHEVGHALTAAHFFADGQFEATGYGTPLPDWLEEAIAIWVEPAASRESRIAAARKLPDHRLDLWTILRSRHPAAGSPAAMAVRDGAAPPADPDLVDFYQQAVAVLAFVHDHGGPVAVRELAIRLRADPGDNEAIVGLQGLPATSDAVDRAWQEWLAEPDHPS
jgi:hypothetical protein